jgi:hypothetical protein
MTEHNAANNHQRYKVQTKAFRYRFVVTIETDTEIAKPLDCLTVEAPADATVGKFIVPVEGDTIAHGFPTLAVGAPENPFSVVAEIVDNEV